ncbi:hypothetical protein [Butyrivibrio sp. NC2007]|uniref:hypothetical protein n=1 Tax=Butyrivibrio sp. NC2007 TaxID=1280683 RepID=UPI0003B499B8|nr:hypothetical protein [Butyrivibrio sp. NC2007]
MGIFEGITHSEEIQELLDDAQSQYDSAKGRLDTQKKNTTKSLEKLGKEKVHAWSKDMNKFLDSFGSFNNVQMVCKIDENYNFLGKNETPNELMVNMRNASYNAGEIIKAGALSVGTGALVGIATYGGVAMFANASTGTAIATLKGVVKKNATLAWLGGGSIASGGMGMAGGTVVLGGVVVGAIAVAGGLIAGAKGKAKLAEARRVHAEAESAVSQMNVVITGMQGIENVSNNYRDFISKLSGLFTPYLKEMDNIASKYQRGSDGKVDFNDLSEMEQKTLHLSWLLAQLYYHILSAPLLNEQGEIEPSSRQLLQKAQQEYVQLTGQATELENEKKKINDLLVDAQKTFSKASQSYYKKKQTTSNKLIDIGKNRIDLWEKTFSPFMDSLSNFEDISVSNTYPYSVTDIPIEFIFESSDSVLSYIKRLRTSGIDALGNTGFVEVALFGGEDFLGELSQLDNDNNAVNSVHRHNMSLWFTGELDPTISDNTPFGEVSDYYISTVKQTVDGISGRENLAQASAVNQEVKDLSNKIGRAVSDFDATIKKIGIIEKTLKKYNKIQAKFLKKIEEIRAEHQTANETVKYDLLSEAEKRVFEMSFVMAKIQYTILASCILTQSNGGDVDDADIVIDTANSAYRSLMRDSFKKAGDDDIETINVMWKENADRAMVVGFATAAICIAVMIAQLIAGNLIGLVGIAGVLIAFPIFFYFKNLSQNKLFMWRCIRIAVAILVVGAAEIIRLVV